MLYCILLCVVIYVVDKMMWEKIVSRGYVIHKSELGYCLATEEWFE